MSTSLGRFHIYGSARTFAYGNTPHGILTNIEHFDSALAGFRHACSGAGGVKCAE